MEKVRLGGKGCPANRHAVERRRGTGGRDGRRVLPGGVRVVERGSRIVERSRRGTGGLVDGVTAVEVEVEVLIRQLGGEGVGADESVHVTAEGEVQRVIRRGCRRGLEGADDTLVGRVVLGHEAIIITRRRCQARDVGFEGVVTDCPCGGGQRLGGENGGEGIVGAQLQGHGDCVAEVRAVSSTSPNSHIGGGSIAGGNAKEAHGGGRMRQGRTHYHEAAGGRQGQREGSRGLQRVCW